MSNLGANCYAHHQSQQGRLAGKSSPKVEAFLVLLPELPIRDFSTSREIGEDLFLRHTRLASSGFRPHL